jgi:hypothetical protein
MFWLLGGHHFTNDVVFKFSAVGWHSIFTLTAPKDKKKLKDGKTILTKGGVEAYLTLEKAPEFLRILPSVEFGGVHMAN